MYCIEETTHSYDYLPCMPRASPRDPPLTDHRHLYSPLYVHLDTPPTSAPTLHPHCKQYSLYIN